MIIIRVKLDIKAEEIKTLLAYMKTEVQKVNAIDGCEIYAFHQNTNGSNKFLLYEEWRDMDSFDAYKNSDVFKQTMATLSPLMASKPDSAYYDSIKVGP